MAKLIEQTLVITVSKMVANSDNETALPFFLNNKLARMGNVCLRSTMPLTSCSGLSNLSLDVLTSSMVLIPVIVYMYIYL